MRDYPIDAFFSYRRADGSALAAWLERRIRTYAVPQSLLTGLDDAAQTALTRPLETFLDTRQERAGEDFFAGKIMPSLEAARRLVLILTPSAWEPGPGGAANWLRRELEIFAELKRVEPEREVLVVLGPGAEPERLQELMPAPETPGAEANWDWADCRDFTGLSPIVPWRAAALDGAVPKLVAALREVPHQLYPKLARLEERRRNRRLQAAGGGLVAIVLALSALAGWALVERNNALAEQLAAEARRLSADDPARALAFALASWERRETDTAELAIRAVLAAHPPYARLPAAGRIGIDERGALVFAGRADGSAVLYTLMPWREVLALPAGTLDPDGPVLLPSLGAPKLAALGADGALRLWDPARSAGPVATIARENGVWPSKVALDEGTIEIGPRGSGPPHVIKLRLAGGYVRLSPMATHRPCDDPWEPVGLGEVLSYAICSRPFVRRGRTGTLSFHVKGTENGLGVVFDEAGRDGSLRHVAAVVTGHTNRVFDVSASADGRWLVTASSDNSAIVTNLPAKALGVEAARLRPLFDAGVARSLMPPTVWHDPTDRWVITPGKIWQTTWRSDLLRRPDRGCVDWARFSADGTSIVGGGAPREARHRWKLTGEREWVYDRPGPEGDDPPADWPADRQAPGATSTATDGTRTVTVSEGRVQVDARDGGTLWSRQIGVGAEAVAAFSPDGRVIGILPKGTSQSYSALFLDAGTGADIGTVSYPDREVVAFAIGPENRTAILATRSGAGTQGGVHHSEVWDLGAQVRLGKLFGDRNWVEDVAISPDGRWIATVAWGRATAAEDTPCGIRMFRCPYCVGRDALIAAAEARLQAIAPREPAAGD